MGLLPFDFTINHLHGSKMGLVDCILREPQQEADNMSTYDEQFIFANLDAIKRSAKRFLLGFQTFTDFAEQNEPF